MKRAIPEKFEGDSIELCLRVLGYQLPNKSWAAHCLETDLVGYGPNFDKALDDLKELTDLQVSFAVFKNQPALLDRSAPAEIIETYNTLLRTALQRFTLKESGDKKRRIASMHLPSHSSSSDFNLVQA